MNTVIITSTTKIKYGGKIEMNSILKTFIFIALLVMSATIAGMVYFAWINNDKTVSNANKNINVVHVKSRSDKDISKIKNIISIARSRTEKKVTEAVDGYVAELKGKSETFISWYFGVFTQQSLGILGAWGTAKYLLLGGDNSAANETMSKIKEKFDALVVSPEAAKIRISHMASEAVRGYISEVKSGIVEGDVRYQLDSGDLDSYFDAITIQVSRGSGRSVPLSVKTFAGASALASGLMAEKIQGVVGAVWERLSGRYVSEYAAVEGGGALLGLGAETMALYAGIGIIIWDGVDMYYSAKTETPIMRKNIHEYLDLMKSAIVNEIMAVIDDIKNEVEVVVSNS